MKYRNPRDQTPFSAFMPDTAGDIHFNFPESGFIVDGIKGRHIKKKDHQNNQAESGQYMGQVFPGQETFERRMDGWKLVWFVPETPDEYHKPQKKDRRGKNRG